MWYSINFETLTKSYGIYSRQRIKFSDIELKF